MHIYIYIIYRNSITFNVGDEWILFCKSPILSCAKGQGVVDNGL